MVWSAHKTTTFEFEIEQLLLLLLLLVIYSLTSAYGSWGCSSDFQGGSRLRPASGQGTQLFAKSANSVFLCTAQHSTAKRWEDWKFESVTVKWGLEMEERERRARKPNVLEICRSICTYYWCLHVDFHLPELQVWTREWEKGDERKEGRKEKKRKKISLWIVKALVAVMNNYKQQVHWGNSLDGRKMTSSLSFLGG